MKQLQPMMALVASLILFPANQARAEQSPFEPLIGHHEHLFPSEILMTANLPAEESSAEEGILGDDNGQIGALVTASKANQKVSVSVTMPSLAETSRVDVVLPDKDASYEIYPVMKWNFDKLAAHRQSKPDTVEIQVSVDGKPLPAQTRRVRVHSVNEALFFVDQGEDADPADLSFLFAGYVNEDSPLVDEILAEALNVGTVDSFDGYQSGASDKVFDQVFAVWHTLQRRGIRYSSITQTASGHPQLFAQHVRFIEDSWKNAQANCVDGTVLMASVLRKIDIRPKLVKVPGHMFLAFDLDAEGKETAFLETTMLGDAKRVGKGEVEGLAEGLQGDVEAEASWAQFQSAIEEGNAKYAEGGKRFEDESEPDYLIIDVADAREMGIMPIASQ